MIEIEQNELSSIEGGDFWSPWYALSYAVSYVAGSAAKAFVDASVQCSCDPSMAMS